ncbi:hypothetical protein [Pseudorhodobacter sp. E13]|uniref:hypothetical protein n=1 Tax=Pseudorhodobacter sp. E13 TaxID=2487931 RepID=UPI000F8F6595|nr:hypothetical protein [Pseudorhodobacter sp. E13]
MTNSTEVHPDYDPQWLDQSSLKIFWQSAFQLSGSWSGPWPPREIHHTNARLWNGLARRYFLDYKQIQMCEEFGIDIPELPEEQIDGLREVLIAKSGLSPERVAECGSSINFDNQIFHDELNLVGMVFPTTFHGDYARFIEGVTLTGSVFLCVTYLPNTSIARCDIRDCRFLDFVNISNATIGNLDASNASFSEGLYCEKTKIGGCSFEGCKFDRHLNICFSEFELPPSFHSASLCDLIEIEGVKWPPVPKERESALQHAKNYESLRRHLSSVLSLTLVTDFREFHRVCPARGVRG